MAFDDEFAAHGPQLTRRARRWPRFRASDALNATALMAAIGDGADIRDAAAIWRLGSGWCRSKRPPAASRGCWGSPSAAMRYLRKLLIHGARAALPTLSRSETPLGAWLRGLLARAHVQHGR